MSEPIEFIGVGRTKKTWTARVPWREDAIIRELRKSKALLSRGIDVEMTQSSGVVLVGGWRQVGTFRKIGGEGAPAVTEKRDNLEGMIRDMTNNKPKDTK